MFKRVQPIYIYAINVEFYGIQALALAAGDAYTIAQAVFNESKDAYVELRSNESYLFKAHFGSINHGE